CVQRINKARIEMKLTDVKGLSTLAAPIPDGTFQSACQQACPTGAITFGDLLDTTGDYADESPGGTRRKGSLVRSMRDNARSYMLLGFLNTRPRTAHMMSVRNPNPSLRTPVVDPFEEPRGAREGHDEHAMRTLPRDAGHKLSLTVLGAKTGVHA